MENLKAIRTLLPYHLIGGLVSAAIGLTIPRGLFISVGVTILVLINQIYTKGEGNLLGSDLLFAGAIISTCAMTLIIIFGTCSLVPHWPSCTSNSFRATVFAIIYFPIIIGCILWIALRSPMIIKALFKK